MERYVDQGEELSLDQRLRLGEALLQTVQRLGDALVGKAATLLLDACLVIAGRRGRRPKHAEEEAKRADLEASRKREADDAWGGEVPQLDDEPETNADNVVKRVLSIVTGWNSAEGEDVRMRTSALSLLGAAIETNVVGLPVAQLSSAVDLSLAVLQLESTEAAAILRRAAVLLLLRLVRAVHAAQEGGRRMGFAFWTENLPDVMRELRRVQVTDGDDMVREHAAAVGAELEAAQYRSVMRAAPSPGGADVPVLGERLAGLSPLKGDGEDARAKIEVLE